VTGVKVSFTFSDNGSVVSTLTDSQGFAVLENAHFDTHPGAYDIVASVEGAGSVTFSVISITAKVVSTYDLIALGGRSGPPFVYGTPEDFGELDGKHIQLFDDGTYRMGYVVKDQTSWSMPAPFLKRSEGVLEFYLNPSLTVSAFYASRNYLYAVGTTVGDTTKVVYQDALDNEDEAYAPGK
jgi:hypothetical protein